MKAKAFLSTAITSMHFNVCKDNEWFDGLRIDQARELVDDDIVVNWFISAVEDYPTIVMTVI